jgi:uncharacterized delta-60 repeat protein
MVLFSKARWLLVLVFIFAARLVVAQVLNPNFAPPIALRQVATTDIESAPNGKIYALGDYDYHTETRVDAVVRLNSDGTLDPTFRPSVPDVDLFDIEVLANGNVVLFGQDRVVGVLMMLVYGTGGQQLAQITELEDPRTIEALPDNGFLVGDGSGIVTRYSPTFQKVSAVQFVNGIIGDLEVQGSKILLSGGFEKYSGSEVRRNVARFALDGTMDLSFNANDAVAYYGGISFGVHVQPDGKIIPLSSASSKPLIRLNANGSRDTGFIYGYPSASTLDAKYVSGKITIQTTNKIVRVNANGSVDATFQPVGFIPGPVRMSVQQDQSVVLINYNAFYGFAKFSSAGQRITAYYARLLQHGEIYSMDRVGSSIFIGGDFIKVGNHFTKNVARLNLDGTVLAKFTASSVTAPVLTVEGFSDGKVLLNTSSRLYRLEHGGAVDPSFSFTPISGMPQIRKFIVQPDGKVLIGGSYRLFRLNSNGSRDLSFSATLSGTPSYDGMMDFDLDRSTGKIIYSSYYYTSSLSPVTRQLLRLQTNGSRDASFNPQLNMPPEYSGVEKVLVLDNQQVFLLLSAFHTANGEPYLAVKLNADGSVDQPFLDNHGSDRDGGPTSDYVRRFGNRLITSTNYIYTGTAVNEVLYLNGTIDTQFIFPPQIEIAWLNQYYADNSTELFIVGHTIIGSTTYQLVKVRYDAVNTAAQTEARVADVSNPSFEFYPNPAEDHLTMQSDAPGVVSIYDGMGQKRITAQTSRENKTIDLRELPKGSYVIEIIENGKAVRKHFIKE